MPIERPLPQPGQMMPDFSLPSTLGRPVRISDFRNRTNLVLLFVDRSDAGNFTPLFQQLADIYPQFRAEHAEILVILPAPIERVEVIKDQSGAPFPLLADPDDRTGFLRTPGGTVYVLDRFGEIYSIQHLGEAEPIPSAEEIFDWVRFIELQCPE